MAIKLYTRQSCKGDCTIVRKNERKLGVLSKLNSTASMELTQADDRVLLFQKQHWEGDALFRAGRRTIEDLGDPAQGGKKGFRNSLNSIRVAPFSIRVRYHVIKSSKGQLPGGYEKDVYLEAFLGKTHYLASAVWEKALIRLALVDIVYHEDDAYFDLSTEAKCRNVDFERDFGIERQYAHVFVVDRSFALGCALPRQTTRGFHIDLREGDSLSLHARTLAHELGHSLGLSHGGNSQKSRLMTQTGASAPEYGTDLSTAEVEAVHVGLADKKEPDSRYRVE
jgi:hypothetical protein